MTEVNFDTWRSDLGVEEIAYPRILVFLGSRLREVNTSRVICSRISHNSPTLPHQPEEAEKTYTFVAFDLNVSEGLDLNVSEGFTHSIPVLLHREDVSHAWRGIICDPNTENSREDLTDDHYLQSIFKMVGTAYVVKTWNSHKCASSNSMLRDKGRRRGYCYLGFCMMLSMVWKTRDKDRKLLNGTDLARAIIGASRDFWAGKYPVHLFGFSSRDRLSKRHYITDRTESPLRTMEILEDVVVPRAASSNLLFSIRCRDDWVYAGDSNGLQTANIRPLEDEVSNSRSPTVKDLFLAVFGALRSYYEGKGRDNIKLNGQCLMIAGWREINFWKLPYDGVRSFGLRYEVLKDSCLGYAQFSVKGKTFIRSSNTAARRFQDAVFKMITGGAGEDDTVSSCLLRVEGLDDVSTDDEVFGRVTEDDNAPSQPAFSLGVSHHSRKRQKSPVAELRRRRPNPASSGPPCNLTLF